MEIPYFVALRLDIETFLLSYCLLTCAILTVSLTSRALLGLHVYYKREISAFFASNIILAISFYLFKVWCTNPTLIVLFMSHAVAASFPFFNGCVLSLEVTVRSILCVKMILIIKKPFSKPASFTQAHTHSFLKCDLSTFYPAKGFKRLLCYPSLLYMILDGK